MAPPHEGRNGADASDALRRQVGWAEVGRCLGGRWVGTRWGVVWPSPSISTIYADEKSRLPPSQTACLPRLAHPGPQRPPCHPHTDLPALYWQAPALYWQAPARIQHSPGTCPYHTHLPLDGVIEWDHRRLGAQVVPHQRRFYLGVGGQGGDACVVGGWVGGASATVPHPRGLHLCVNDGMVPSKCDRGEWLEKDPQPGMHPQPLRACIARQYHKRCHAPAPASTKLEQHSQRCRRLLYFPHLCGADAVAADVDDVIHPSRDPVVAVSWREGGGFDEGSIRRGVQELIGESWRRPPAQRSGSG